MRPEPSGGPIGRTSPHHSRRPHTLCYLTSVSLPSLFTRVSARVFTHTHVHTRPHLFTRARLFTKMREVGLIYGNEVVALPLQSYAYS